MAFFTWMPKNKATILTHGATFLTNHKALWEFALFFWSTNTTEVIILGRVCLAFAWVSHKCFEAWCGETSLLSYITVTCCFVWMVSKFCLWRFMSVPHFLSCFRRRKTPTPAKRLWMISFLMTMMNKLQAVSLLLLLWGPHMQFLRCINILSHFILLI